MTNTSPITAVNYLGSLTWNVTIDPTNSYGNSATLISSLNNVQVGIFKFSPGFNQWQVTNAQVGTTTVSYLATYAPPTGANVGTIVISSGVLTVNGQPNTSFAGTIFSWASDGTLYIPT
ncbi:hypothetical protein [Azospirillum lipoferum]|uniref:hypothetical protein n=1 Tax=Azospirillum lipoferum TaxID=193 RepID=UPI0013964840|nr:hypothetical protein [Azospirillum lipoferum]